MKERKPKMPASLTKASEWTDKGHAARAAGDEERAQQCFDYSTYWFNKYVGEKAAASAKP